MQIPKDNVLIDLFNTLYAIASSYKQIEYLETPVFDGLDEIDSAINIGFSEESFEYYDTNQIFDKEMIDELKAYRLEIDLLEHFLWNSTDFDQHKDWILLRKWSQSLLKRLNMTTYTWNNGGDPFIWRK